VGRPD